MNDVTLITGASSGIGKALAYEYAKHGHSVVLVARRYNELEELTLEIKREHDVAVYFYAADLTDPLQIEALYAWLHTEQLQVEVLVNNAGFGNIGLFVEQDALHNLSMIELNCKALTHLTHLVLPTMVVNGKGNIVNIASTAAFMPGPLQAVYFATKAYVKSFSEALGYELRNTGVKVTTICPGTVATQFAKAANITNDTEFTKGQSPEAVATITYKAMKAGKRTVITRFSLALIINVMLDLLPKRVQLWIVYKAQEGWMR